MIVQHSSVSMTAEHSISETKEVTSSLSAAEFSKHVSEVRAEYMQASYSSSMSMASTSMASFGAGFGMQGLPSFEMPEALQAKLGVGEDGGFFLLPVSTPDTSFEDAMNMEERKFSLLQSLIDALVAARDAARAARDGSMPAVEGPKVMLPEGGEGYQGYQDPFAGGGITRTLEMTVNFQMTVEEYEHSSFQASGLVKTADGRTIDVNLQLNMERSYSATHEYTETQTIVFQDPLILNFDGSYAELSDDKFAFDLDLDGETELISYLTGDSAMLALDKNEDGTINDGSELFGAATGNGFAELAQYDEDGNGYIDEADSIFSELRLWSKTLDGESLDSLADHDVGAIYLGSAETEFALKGEDNQQNGRVRETGFYLAESGGVGTVQEIDMAV